MSGRGCVIGDWTGYTGVFGRALGLLLLYFMVKFGPNVLVSDQVCQGGRVPPLLPLRTFLTQAQMSICENTGMSLPRTSLQAHVAVSSQH